MDFEKYLSEFNSTISLLDFLFNVLVATFSALVIGFYYNRFGNAISNRQRFSAIFVPLILATMLIITIIKSSIALSLGMVGALSIVRFRAAIKDPEELTFLFFIIGIGLATGAGQPLLALLALVIILSILTIIKILTRKTVFRSQDRLYVHISTDVTEVERIAQLLSERFSYVELKRMDAPKGGGLELSFVCKADTLAAIAQAQQAVSALSPATAFSMIEQPDLVV